MKQIPLLQGKVLLIELPEGAADPFVAKTYVDEDGHTYDTDPQWLEWSGTFPNNTLDLPPGNWRIIGMLSEVTEEQAKGVVKEPIVEPPFRPIGSVLTYPSSKVYYDYVRNCWHAETTTSLESLESAILAEGYYLDKNPYAHNLRDAVDKAPRSDYASKLEEVNIFRQAQTRVLDRSRCLLLGRDGRISEHYEYPQDIVKELTTPIKGDR